VSDEHFPGSPDDMMDRLAARDREIAALHEEGQQIDAALETWFYPGELDSRVKAVQETARVWDGIVAALDIGDSDADVVEIIKDMVEYAGDLNETNARLQAEIAALREATLAEREACAKVAEEGRVIHSGMPGSPHPSIHGSQIAAAIRARSTP
jgi:hypothetical protein